MKKNSIVLFRKHDHEHVAKWFLNSKKSKQSQNHEICLDLMISDMEAVGKIENVSHNLSCMMFTNRSILEEES